jgi:glycogen synthase
MTPALSHRVSFPYLLFTTLDFKGTVRAGHFAGCCNSRGNSSTHHENGILRQGRIIPQGVHLTYSDFLSTVSRKYSHEIQTSEYGFGLEGVLRSRAHVITGILNGVDYNEWSPSERQVHRGSFRRPGVER